MQTVAVQSRDSASRVGEVHPVAVAMYVVLPGPCAPPVNRVFAGSPCNDVFNQAFRKAQPAMGVKFGAKGQDEVEQFGKGVADTGVFEDRQRRLVNPAEVAIIEGAVLPALHTGPDRGAVAAPKARLGLGFAISGVPPLRPGIL